MKECSSWELYKCLWRETGRGECNNSSHSLTQLTTKTTSKSTVHIVVQHDLKFRHTMAGPWWDRSRLWNHLKPWDSWANRLTPRRSQATTNSQTWITFSRQRTQQASSPSWTMAVLATTRAVIHQRETCPRSWGTGPRSPGRPTEPTVPRRPLSKTTRMPTVAWTIIASTCPKSPRMGSRFR